MKNTSIRAFFAAELSDATTIKNIENLQVQLDQIIPSIKMVELENLHITIRFLGNTTYTVAEKLFHFIENQINIPYFETEKLNFEVVGLRDFNKRVFYVDLKGPTQILKEINHKIEDHLENAYNFERNQKFRTHITIGRLKRRKYGKHHGENKDYFDKNRYSKLKQQYAYTKLGQMIVDKIVLKKSILTPKGPIYETLKF